LRHHGGDKVENIATAVLNVAANEVYHCEKGAGAVLNKRKIKTSKREEKDGLLCAIANSPITENKIIKDLSAKNATLTISNCASLDIANLAAGKIDLCAFDLSDQEFLSSLLLLAQESGGRIFKKDGLLLISNQKVKFS